MNILRSILEATPRFRLPTGSTEWAMRTGMGCLVECDPALFIWLTAYDQQEYDEIVSEPVDFLAVARRSKLPADQHGLDSPFIDIDSSSGRIINHSGRHRASALLSRGGHDFPFYVRLSDGSGYSGMPERIHAQYHSGSIDRSELRLIRDLHSKKAA